MITITHKKAKEVGDALGTCFLSSAVFTVIFWINNVETGFYHVDLLFDVILYVTFLITLISGGFTLFIIQFIDIIDKNCVYENKKGKIRALFYPVKEKGKKED